MATGVQITFDAADPPALADFWALALGYVTQPPPPGFSSWPDWLRQMGIPEERWGDMASVVDPDGKGPRLLFQKVPEPKTAKNRVHLDVNAGAPDHDRPRVDAHVARLVDAGGAVQREVELRGERWVVMTDPEGNEFCVQ
ncbi:MAG: VOC family protein [Acidimicrobiia bacterium]